MTLKTGRSCTWEEIEVGEVFAYDGCWKILYKDSDSSTMCLAIDFLGKTYDEKGWSVYLGKNSFLGIPYKGFYKLPKSVQRLWRED